ncbi:MAG: glycosyltransferase [Alphaproteobacteria bacterium]
MALVAPFCAEPGGGGVYTRSVISLLRAAFGEGALDVVAPAPHKSWPPLAERAWCVAASAFGPYPSKAVFSRRSGLDAALRADPGRLDGRILIINGADSYWFADAYGGAATRRVLICHNIESVLYSDHIDSLGPVAGLVLRGVLGDDEKFRRLESRAFAESDLVVCISSEDAAYIEANHGGTPTHHLPPVFDYPPYAARRAAAEPRSRPALRLGFLAKFGWWPNEDAARWLVREIMPRLPDDRELHLFGLGSARHQSPRARVFAHGFVDDLDEVWRACDIVLCPMRRGGGVNVKFAEALYNGMPVCATPLAARGLRIDSRDAPGLKYLADTDEWVTFLGSDAATAFAAAKAPAALGEGFASARQVAPLRDAFERFVFNPGA